MEKVSIPAQEYPSYIDILKEIVSEVFSVLEKKRDIDISNKYKENLSDILEKGGVSFVNPCREYTAYTSYRLEEIKSGSTEILVISLGKNNNNDSSIEFHFALIVKHNGKQYIVDYIKDNDVYVGEYDEKYTNPYEEKGLVVIKISKFIGIEKLETSLLSYLSSNGYDEELVEKYIQLYVSKLEKVSSKEFDIWRNKVGDIKKPKFTR